MENDWAVAVGINYYPKAKAIVSPLEGAVGDATNFGEWACDSLGGDVPESQLKVFTNANKDDPNPIKSQVTSFFETLLGEVQTREARRLYIYLSGHGIMPLTQSHPGATALLMANAILPRYPHAFGGTVWASGLRDAPIFEQVVLIMDCCRDLNQNANADQHIFGQPSGDAAGNLLVTAYATGWDSRSRELVFDGECGNRKQGAFTRSLLAVQQF